ncbi:hypothetical protein KDL01_06310 [Actinospica durhamensis]|uniref:WD40 repeat protein n=1 Tax=Actinospica durhamensis TaxID=1508375 RepID=A0A941EKI7_9ACTN|nr:hypothetical protein [Actinospica durhamensis]MBR7832866.1 hypothetical protein [Actinospica durhamensis]
MPDSPPPAGPGELVCVVLDDVPGFDPLEKAAERVAAAIPRLDRLGFATQGTDLRGGGRSADVLGRLEAWTPRPGRPLLLYWTGHGVLHREQLLLVCRDSPREPGAETAAVVRADMLGALLAAKRVEQIIVFVDTYREGGGIDELIRGYREKRESLPTAVAKQMSLAVLGTAQRDEQAAQGAFADALIRFVDGPHTGSAELERSRRLTVDQFSEALQQILDDTTERRQTLERLSSGVGEPTLDNPYYKPHLPDFPTQLRAGRRPIIDRELSEHFMLKFRGIEVLGDRGWYFSGRRRTLEEITAWLGRPQHGLFVLTGPPGCGKSAVLGRLAVLSDPRSRRLAEEAGALARPTGAGRGPLDVGLHIRGLTLAECVAGIAAGLGVMAEDARELCQAVAARSSALQRQLVVMVDALDEAKPADRLAIAADLLRPLAEIGHAKVLVGVRAEAQPDGSGAASAVAVLEPGADRVWRLERDDPDGESDIAAYIRYRLMDHADSPYARLRRTDAAQQAGLVLARRADGIFLLARAFCQVLEHQPEIPDLATADSQELFSQDVNRVFAADLARFGSEEALVRDVLVPLAWAEGKGLPAPLWAALIGTMRADGPALPAEGMRALIEKASAYLIESSEDEQPVYRLYAEQFARFLRSGTDAVAAQSAMTETLLASFQENGVRVWERANPYVRRHLAAHAAAAGMLRTLVADPHFLGYADPDGLRAVIGEVDPQHEDFARLFGRVAHRMRALTTRDRLALLQESASRDEPELLPRLNLTGLVWRGLGSTSVPTPFHRVLGGSGLVPSLVGFLRADERPLVASYDGATVNVWDPANGERLQTLGRIHATGGVAAFGTVRTHEDLGAAGSRVAPVLAYVLGAQIMFVDVLTGASARPPLRVGEGVSVLGFARIGEREVLAVAQAEKVLILAWRDGARIRTLETGRVGALAWSARGAEAYLATADQSGVTLWDPASGEPRHRVGAAHEISALTIAVAADGPVLAFDGPRSGIGLWHAARGESELAGHTEQVSSLTLLALGSALLLASGAADGTTRLWDPVSGSSLVLQERAEAVTAVSLAAIDERPVLATAAAKDRDVRLWDPAPEPVGSALGHSSLRTPAKTARTVAFNDNRDEPSVVVGTESGTLELCRLDGRRLLAWELPGRVASAAAHGASAAAGLVGGRIAVCHRGSQNTRVFDAHRGVVDALVFLPNGVLASGGADGTVKFWAPGTLEPAGRPLRPEETGGSGGSGITALACAETTAGVLLACTSATATSVYTVPGRERLCEVPRTRGTRPTACAIAEIAVPGPSDQGAVIPAAQGVSTVLAVGDEAGGLRLFDAATGTLLRRLVGHTERVHHVALGRLGGRDVLASAARDGTVRLWDPVDGACLDVWTERAQWLRAATFRFHRDRLLRGLVLGSAAHFAQAERAPDGLRSPE